MRLLELWFTVVPNVSWCCGASTSHMWLGQVAYNRNAIKVKLTGFSVCHAFSAPEVCVSLQPPQPSPETFNKSYDQERRSIPLEQIATFPLILQFPKSPNSLISAACFLSGGGVVIMVHNCIVTPAGRPALAARPKIDEERTAYQRHGSVASCDHLTGGVHDNDDGNGDGRAAPAFSGAAQENKVQTRSHDVFLFIVSHGLSKSWLVKSGCNTMTVMIMLQKKETFSQTRKKENTTTKENNRKKIYKDIIPRRMIDMYTCQEEVSLNVQFTLCLRPSSHATSILISWLNHYCPLLLVTTALALLSVTLGAGQSGSITLIVETLKQLNGWPCTFLFVGTG